MEVARGGERKADDKVWQNFPGAAAVSSFMELYFVIALHCWRYAGMGRHGTRPGVPKFILSYEMSESFLYN